MSMIAEQGNSSTASAEKTVSNRWYALTMFVLAYGLNNLDKAIISVLIVPLKQEFGLSDSQLSLLSGMAITLPYILVCIPMGMLADRFSRKWMLIGLLASWSLATVGAGFAAGVAALFVARVLVGIFEAGFNPVTMSLIGDFFPKRSRATALGLFALGAPLGLFLAMAVGAVIASDYGWRAAFLMAGAPGVLLAILMAFTIREPQRTVSQPQAASGPSLKTVLRYIATAPVTLNVMLGMVLAAALMAVLAIWLPTFFIRVHGIDGKTAGLFSALIVGGCGALGAALGGVAADKLAGSDSRKLVMVSVATIVAASCVLAGTFVPEVLLGGVLLGLGAFLAQAIFGTGYGLIISQTPLQMRATVLSVLFVSFNVLSYGFGSLIVGVISDGVAPMVGSRSIAFGIAASSVTSVWAAFHLLRASRYLRRTEHSLKS